MGRTGKWELEEEKIKIEVIPTIKMKWWQFWKRKKVKEAEKCAEIAERILNHVGLKNYQREMIKGLIELNPPGEGRFKVMWDLKGVFPPTGFPDRQHCETLLEYNKRVGEFRDES